MNRSLLLSVTFNLLMMVIVGVLVFRDTPALRESTVEGQSNELYTVPRGPEGGPFRNGVIVCHISNDPNSVASRVLARRKEGGTEYDIDIYVEEKEQIDRIVGFLKVLSSAGITNRLRIIVPTASGPVTLDGFSSSPLSAFKDYQEWKDNLNK